MGTERPPASTLWRRAILALAFSALPFVVAAVGHWDLTHNVVKDLSRYTPERFVHGAVWTLPISALITARATHVSVAIGVMLVLLTPYVILAGFPRAIVRFFAGHVTCTLLTLVVIVTASAAGSATATKLYSTTDTGISAGLAAVGGAFVVLLWRSPVRWLAVAAFAVPLYFYTYRVGSEAVPGLMADVEHVIAFVVGIMIEWRRPLRSWPERVAAADRCPPDAPAAQMSNAA
jgi:hypothetical protein